MCSKVKNTLLIILAFRSMEPYFFWSQGVITVLIVLLLLCIQAMQFFYTENPIRFSFKKFVILCISWGLFFIYKHLFWSTSIKDIVVSFISTFIPVFILIICSNEEKKSFVEGFTSFISIVLFFSLIEYLLFVFGVLQIEPIKIYEPGADTSVYFDNYGLFLVVFDLRNFLFPRFQSVFTEPGHLGMMCALILYANGYKLKDKRVFIIFVSALLSMSLASYILLLAGIFLYKYCVSNKKVVMALVLSITAYFIIGGSILYYNAFPESGLSTGIIARLFPDDEKGIQGNNRTTIAFKKAFAEQMSEINKDSLFGYGVNALTEKIPDERGNSSGSCFIFMFGIVGGLLLISFYLSIIYINYSTVIVGMFLLYFLSFIQRPYATWFAQISLMICASVKYRETYLYSIKKEKKYGNGSELYKC